MHRSGNVVASSRRTRAGTRAAIQLATMTSASTSTARSGTNVPNTRLQGMPDTAVGAENAPIITGNGAQENSLFQPYRVPKDLRSFTGEPEDWPIYNSQLKFYTNEATNGKIDLDSETCTWEQREDRFLYQCLLASLDRRSINTIVFIYEDQGHKAYNHLKEAIQGSLYAQYQDTLDLNTTLKMKEIDDLEYYTTQLAKLERDLIFHDIARRDENGAIPTLISFSLANLPPRFNIWQLQQSTYYRMNEKFPTVTRYINELRNEDRRLKKQAAKVTARSMGNLPIQSVSTNVGYTHTQRPTNSATRKQRRAAARGNKPYSRGATAAAGFNQNYPELESIIRESISKYFSTQNPQQNSASYPQTTSNNRGRGSFRGSGNGRGNFSAKRFNYNRGNFTNRGGNNYRNNPNNNKGGHQQSLNSIQPNVSDNTSIFCIICNRANSHTTSDCRNVKCKNCWVTTHTTAQCPNRAQ